MSPTVTFSHITWPQTWPFDLIFTTQVETANRKTQILFYLVFFQLNFYAVQANKDSQPKFCEGWIRRPKQDQYIRKLLKNSDDRETDFLGVKLTKQIVSFHRQVLQRLLQLSHRRFQVGFVRHQTHTILLKPFNLTQTYTDRYTQTHPYTYTAPPQVCTVKQVQTTAAVLVSQAEAIVRPRQTWPSPRLRLLTS